ERDERSRGEARGDALPDDREREVFDARGDARDRAQESDSRALFGGGTSDRRRPALRQHYESARPPRPPRQTPRLRSPDNGQADDVHRAAAEGVSRAVPALRLSAALR